jgi:DNA-binding transcriptional ArsR family regulator
MKPARQEAIDPRVIKALAHPLRVELLGALNQKVASPKELAEEFGERLPNVSYHIRVLVNAGCIELVRTEPRRGALEHFYRAQMRPLFRDEAWAELPPSTRRSVSDSILRAIWADTAEATRNGNFDAREERHLSRSKLLLDEQGWLEVNRLLEEAMDRAHEIHAESVSRLNEADTGDDDVYSDLVIMHYTGEPSREGDQPTGAEPRQAKRAKS